MLRFNRQKLSSRLLCKYGLLALTTFMLCVTLVKWPSLSRSHSSLPEKEVLVRQFLSHASELAIRYQHNQLQNLRTEKVKNPVSRLSLGLKA